MFSNHNYDFLQDGNLLVCIPLLLWNRLVQKEDIFHFGPMSLLTVFWYVYMKEVGEAKRSVIWRYSAHPHFFVCFGDSHDYYYIRRQMPCLSVTHPITLNNGSLLDSLSLLSHCYLSLCLATIHSTDLENCSPGLPRLHSILLSAGVNYLSISY